MSRPQSRFGLVILGAVILALAACDQLPSAPLSPERAQAAHVSSRDDGDTTTCLSGFVVVDGRYVCN
jgi:curli biogenesis system outer membrane secretion channel CsgG